MHCFADQHKPLCVGATRNENSTDSEHPDAERRAYSGGMSQCTALKWLVDRAIEHELTSQQIAVMAMLLGLQERGRATISKAELGALVGLKERQVANVLLSLESEILAFIKKDGRRGRAANSYRICDEAISQPSNPLPVMECSQQPIAGNTVLVTKHNQQPIAGDPLPGSPQKPLRHIEHAGARVEDNSSLIRVLELNPEREESSGESVAHARSVSPTERFSGPMTETLPYTEAMSAFAAERGFLNGSGVELFEQFRDYHLAKHTISANWLASWRKWVRDQVKFQPNGAVSNERTGTPSNYRGRRRSLSTEVLDRLCSDGAPSDFGRLDSYAIK